LSRKEKEVSVSFEPY